MQKSNRNEHNLLKMLYLCTRLEVARKGRRVNILVEKRTFTKRFLRGTDLANQSIRRNATGASTLGVLYPAHFCCG